MSSHVIKNPYFFSISKVFRPFHVGLTFRCFLSLYQTKLVYYGDTDDHYSYLACTFFFFFLIFCKDLLINGQLVDTYFYNLGVQV